LHSDGLFLDACMDVAKDYPDVKFDDVSLDNACLNVGST
jgi:isocitrate dehydrogenase (NAD+)